MMHPTARLDTLCRAVNVGHVGPSSMHRDPNGVPFLMGKNVGFGVINHHNIERVTEAFHRSQPKSVIRGGDVLVVRIGKSGQAAKVPESLGEANCSGLVIIKEPKGVTADFLVYFLNSPIGRGHSLLQARGATRLTLNTRSIAAARIPVPPLPEQKRIVGILDEAFASIGTAKANAERNLQNARALFESQLQAVITQGGPGWVQKTLGDVCSIARGGSPRPIQKFLTTAHDGINWIKIGDATASGKYIHETEDKIIPEGAKRSRIVHDGDFLLSNSMSFGRPYIMRTTGCVHDGWLVLSNYASHLDQDYLYLVLGSQGVFQQFDRLAAGSTVRNLNIELASRVEIPVPPLEQQRNVARRLETMSGETERLAFLYERKLGALETLKRSLLHQAFTGQL